MTPRACPAIIAEFGPRKGEVCGAPVTEGSKSGLCHRHATQRANAERLALGKEHPWRAWRGPIQTKGAGS